MFVNLCLRAGCQKRLLVFVCVLITAGGCAIGSAGRRPAVTVEDLTLERIDRSIDLAAGYMIRNCDAEGRFSYLANTDPGVKVKPGYNIIRHAGAIYALCMYEQSRPDDRTRQAILRSAGFLKRESVAPVEGQPEMLAVWSKEKSPVYAKLGGTGLGLVALVNAEKILPGTTSIDDLRKLGRFLLFMQKGDGSFYTKYSAKDGRIGHPPSLFYPGEACLGLLALYGIDPRPEWLQGASNGVSRLAAVRDGPDKLELDYWTLIASAELLKHYDRRLQPVSYNVVLRHAVGVCGYVVDYARNNFRVYYGCFSGDRRTTPTSAALEGLLAALTYLPEEERSLERAIVSVTGAGAAFVLSGQVTEGDLAGGFPAKVPDTRKARTAKVSNADSEIRIDYVQHALSALLRYREFIEKKRLKALE